MEAITVLVVRKDMMAKIRGSSNAGSTRQNQRTGREVKLS